MRAPLLPIAAAGLALACTPNDSARPRLVSSESWCPEGFEIGPQDTCFAIPDKHDGATPVLVYLHGMYSGHGSPEEWRLVRGAVDRGFAVVVPRGKRGLCAWKAELKDHFCWPQEVDDPQAFKNVVAEWDRVLWQVDALLEPGTHKRYVLGYSNGGFFATYLATHGLFFADGYAIVNGGLLDPSPSATLPRSASMLLIAARDDARHGPKDIHDAFTKGGVPHAWCARPGAHALTAEDVDAALRFFKHDADGKPVLGCEGGTKPGP